GQFCSYAARARPTTSSVTSSTAASTTLCVAWPGPLEVTRRSERGASRYLRPRSTRVLAAAATAANCRLRTNGVYDARPSTVTSSPSPSITCLRRSKIGLRCALAPEYWPSMYSSSDGGTQPATLAAASAIAHCEFCLTPCSVLSHRRTAFWSRGSMPLAATSATHSSSVRPVRSFMLSVTASSMSCVARMVMRHIRTARETGSPGDEGYIPRREVPGALRPRADASPRGLRTGRRGRGHGCPPAALHPGPGAARPALRHRRAELHGRRRERADRLCGPLQGGRGLLP